MTERVVINVSGTTFETLPETLKRFPKTLLGSPRKRRRYYDTSMKGYYFNRHRIAFEYILFYYQSNGRLVLPVDVPFRIFTEEVQFFQLGEQALNSIAKGMLKNKKKLPNGTWRQKLWNLFEQPDTSILARIIAMFSISMVGVSLVLSCIETIPSLRVQDCLDSVPSNNNSTVQFEEPSYNNTTGSTGSFTRCQQRPLNVFIYVETICYVWFLLEYLIRLLSSPDKIDFFCSLLNVIDLLAIFPYFIILIAGSERVVSLSVLRITRLFRVFRILKLTQYSSGLRILGNTMRASMKELEMVMLFALITVVLSSSAIYYADIDSSETNFNSIPGAAWWSITTITTVGYGDLIPVTGLGKFVGCICAVLGVLIFSLPVMAFATNFNAYLKCEPIRGQLMDRKASSKSFKRSSSYSSYRTSTDY
ncbi:shaker-related potassium channel tsha2-like [Actinia tenebrosa]|uniref:Shaker-related potassium channel tsha2-like n=1 Tax=Actinia tenebrosa TaxID=6105 RepID=A0A6P8HI55_ACTTE|nr:shaker-related potassium channel tsha2-like [Actinia tenebrosa]